jgi:hypothetical protein
MSRHGLCWGVQQRGQGLGQVAPGLSVCVLCRPQMEPDAGIALLSRPPLLLVEPDHPAHRGTVLVIRSPGLERLVTAGTDYQSLARKR